MLNWYFASGDLGYFWDTQLHAFSWLPQIWEKDQGFGLNSLVNLWLGYPFRLVIKLLVTLGLSWFVIEKLLWLSVFVLSVYSSYRLARQVLGKSPLVHLAPLIYAGNTYFLLLFGGGQLGVALAYALVPLVFLKFMKNSPIANGLWLALLVAFDLRFAYLILGAILLYMIIEKKFSLFYAFGISLIVAASVHMYWILPTALASRGVATLGDQFTNPGMLKFLSFADFSHALSLLHPNWPENLFGKVYFLQPEFLMLPIIAFSSLLFIKQKNDNRRLILFFVLLSVIGAFLAKGVNEPFGGIFQWMFAYVPGFIMFRDPTKFYVFTAIGYSILIPFTLERINKRFFLILFLVFWIFTIRAVLMGEVSGNFKPQHVPAEYVQLKNLLVSDTNPSRTLWIPQNENFAFSSDIHPLLSSNQLFKNASVSAVIAMTNQSQFMKTLQDAGVKYVIVPEDSEKRIFLNDYRFDLEQRNALIIALGNTSLQRIGEYRDVAVFENNNFSMHAITPQQAVVQQKLATIGLAVSVIMLIWWFVAFRVL